MSCGFPTVVLGVSNSGLLNLLSDFVQVHTGVVSLDLGWMYLSTSVWGRLRFAFGLAALGITVQFRLMTPSALLTAYSKVPSSWNTQEAISPLYGASFPIQKINANIINQGSHNNT